MKLLGLLRRPWFQVLSSGIVLFFALVTVARQTENPNFYPSVLLLGAFLVPVAFVTWIYGRVRPEGIAMPELAICFLWGGAIGTMVAGILEYATLRDFGPVPLLGVGLIEESAKLIAPLVIYRRARHRSEASGVVFGVASGMGFAALETMGYGFVALIASHGSISAVEATLFVRGLLSPAGHGAWTGLVCAVLWRERERGGHAFPGRSVIAAFLAAVVLHALWDTFNSLTGPTFIDFAGIELLSLGVAVLSLTLLIRRIHEATTRKPAAAAQDAPR